MPPTSRLRLSSACDSRLSVTSMTMPIDEQRLSVRVIAVAGADLQVAQLGRAPGDGYGSNR